MCMAEEDLLELLDLLGVDLQVLIIFIFDHHRLRKQLVLLH